MMVAKLVVISQGSPGLASGRPGYAATSGWGRWGPGRPDKKDIATGKDNLQAKLLPQEKIFLITFYW